MAAAAGDVRDAEKGGLDAVASKVRRALDVRPLYSRPAATPVIGLAASLSRANRGHARGRSQVAPARTRRGGRDTGLSRRLRLAGSADHNYITNDVASHDAILHPSFVCVNSNGSCTERAAYLKRWATGFHPDVVPYWDVRDENITMIGTIALVRSTNKHTFYRDGVETTEMTTYTDTYLYDRGQWLCVQAQLTPVAPDFEPGDDTIISIYRRGVKQE